MRGGIRIPTSKNPTPFLGELYYDPNAHMLWVFNGYGSWSLVSDRLCLHCKYAESDHARYSNEYSDGHPFIACNLELLEYLSARREHRV